MQNIAIVIPARFASTRLPGKPLLDIAGKPMIEHVYLRALKVRNVSRVVVATDDERVADVVHGFDGECLLTSPAHASGTDRLVEVMQHVEADLYVNLQGDEPLIRPADIQTLIDGMQHDSGVQVGTLCHSLPLTEAANSNQVKVVLATNGDALYFSRSPIPFPRDAEKAAYLKHVGIYAYRRDVLQLYSALPRSILEETESLEQLRLLSAGIRIRAFHVAPTGPGVDTPECLQRVRSLMAGSEFPA